MRYAGIIKNDFSAGEGTCVTFYTQGCPHQCKGCHNPETWDFLGGKEFTPCVLDEILDAIKANNLQRNFCVMGGEPLCEENIFLTNLVISKVREKYPDIEITIWTGSLYEDLLEESSPHLRNILNLADKIVDGPYVEEERDITLPMRGSKNQRIIDLK